MIWLQTLCWNNKKFKFFSTISKNDEFNFSEKYYDCQVWSKTFN